ELPEVATAEISAFPDQTSLSVVF
ncbi:uncharacterized protein METZ01_LOCUS262066, partial [marine metagenome]